VSCSVAPQGNSDAFRQGHALAQARLYNCIHFADSSNWFGPPPVCRCGTSPSEGEMNG